jgi:hypothetical protein
LLAKPADPQLLLQLVAGGPLALETAVEGWARVVEQGGVGGRSLQGETT